MSATAEQAGAGQAGTAASPLPPPSPLSRAPELPGEVAGRVVRTAVPVGWVGAWILLASASAVAASGLVFAAGGTRGFFVPLLAAAVCLVAAFWDVLTGRIPNALTYTAMLAGLALNGAAPVLIWLGQGTAVTWLGGPGMRESLLGFGACAGMWMVASLFRGAVHGGDLKLLVALGALLGLTQAGNMLVLALLVAVVYALINLAVVGHLNAVFRIAAQRVMELAYLKRFHTPLPEDAEPVTARQIPMAVPLAMGLLLAYYWQWRTGGGLLL